MTTRDRNILVVIGGLAVLAAFWFLAIKPKRAEVQTLTGQIATQQSRLATAQATVSSGLAAKAAYPKDYAAVAQLGKALPADDDLPSLLYQLDAESHGKHIALRVDHARRLRRRQRLERDAGRERRGGDRRVVAAAGRDRRDRGPRHAPVQLHVHRLVLRPAEVHPGRSGLRPRPRARPSPSAVVC